VGFEDATRRRRKKVESLKEKKIREDGRERLRLWRWYARPFLSWCSLLTAPVDPRATSPAPPPAALSRPRTSLTLLFFISFVFFCFWCVHLFFSNPAAVVEKNEWGYEHGVPVLAFVLSRGALRSKSF